MQMVGEARRRAKHLAGDMLEKKYPSNSCVAMLQKKSSNTLCGMIY